MTRMQVVMIISHAIAVIVEYRRREGAITWQIHDWRNDNAVNRWFYVDEYLRVDFGCSSESHRPQRKVTHSRAWHSSPVTKALFHLDTKNALISIVQRKCNKVTFRRHTMQNRCACIFPSVGRLRKTIVSNICWQMIHTRKFTERFDQSEPRTSQIGYVL